MHVLITGATGQVGRFIAAGLSEAGHRVTALGRPDWTLADAAPRLPAADALVHAAFSHVAGAYRGGEGDDPEGFWRLNHGGSLALFAAARAAGIPRWLFLSSRAVYGDHRRGAVLRETDAPAPGTLYGRMKLAVEMGMQARAEGAARAVSLRATGVYGLPPGAASHKWSGLFADHVAGHPAAPRAGGEVHGADLAEAVRRLLEAEAAGVFNVADLTVDRHDLLARLGALTGSPHPPPPPAAGPPPGEMATDRLRALGWTPGGAARLDAFLRAEAARLVARPEPR